MVALPIVGSDNNIWGTELNTFLSVAHNADGTPKTEQLALADASDVTLTSAAANHELIRDSTHWFNILHRYRPQAYVGFVGDGVADDSTPVTNMLNDMLSAGRGYAEFPNNHAIALKNMPVYPRAMIDFNGCTLQLHTSGTTSDDLIRTNNFNTLTNTTTDVAGGAPWGFELMNGFLFTPTANTARHTVAIYGVAYRLANLHVMHSGIGSALWTEYGSSTTDWTVNQPNQWHAGKSLIFSDISILDGVSTSGVLTAPAINDFSLVVTNAVLSGGNTVLTVTTARPHFVNSANHTITLASIGGVTGASGNFTCTGTPSSTTLTVSGSFGGAYTSGGTVSYHVSAGWTHLGPSDGQATNIYAYATTHVAGRRGLLCGSNNNNSGAGLDITNIHVYNNWSVGGDFRCGGVTTNGGQFEGSVKCCLILRENGRYQYNGRIYGGFGGNTLLSQRDSNHNKLDIIMHQGGSGNAPASGFNNVYWENYNSGNLLARIMMQHDYNTNAKAASGQAPTQSYVEGWMNAFGISSATLSSDFGTSVSSTTWGYAAFPTGLTWVGT